MNLNLKDKVVLITGGSKGIGAGISEVFAQEGARLIINYHSNRDEAEHLKEHLFHSYGASVELIQGDVGIEADAKKIFDVAEKAFGVVQILINNAGRGYTCPFPDITLEDWNAQLKDNLTGQFLMGREFARRLIPTSLPGWIVNICSKASLTSTTPGRASYVANKAGEWGLTHAMAVDLTQYGIHVNGIMPGFVLAHSLLEQKEHDQDEFKHRIDRVPLKRVGEPWEIGTMAAFLSSDKCELAVGTVIDMTGGLLLGF